MKIVHPDHQRLVRERDQALNQYLERLEVDLDFMCIDFRLCRLLIEKYEYCEILEEIKSCRESALIRRAEMIAANNFIARGFKKFRHLPPELRSCVWSLASLDHAQSRVHIIFLDTQRSKYVSNQHRSALLRTCFESRAEYLRSTKTTFAFENHINFEIDTVLVWETFATYNADQNIPDDFLTTWFSNFLKFQATSQIKHLALGEDIFLALDPEVVNSLRIVMPQCREVTVLVDGTRSTLEIADLKLTHLSARQQRKLLAVVEVRHWAKACNLFGLKKGNGREDDFLKIRYAIAEPLEETSKELDEQSSCSDEGDT